MNVVMLALYRSLRKKIDDRGVALFYTQIIPAIALAFLVIDVYMLAEYVAGGRFSAWPYEHARTAIFLVIGVAYLLILSMAPKADELEKMKVAPEVLQRSTNLAWILFPIPFLLFVLLVTTFHG